jgi:hypothetical protein
MAWLHAVPIDKHVNSKKQKVSRLQSYLESNPDSDELQMPELDGADYLVSYLTEIGPAVSNGFGPSVVSWSDIDCWMTRTGLDLSPWEVLTLRDLSKVYVSELSQASDPNRPAPYVKIKPVELPKEEVANKLMSALRTMARK